MAQQDLPVSAYRTQMGRVLGLGSAKTGAHHWLSFRLASLALIPLNLWLVYSLVQHLGVYHVVIMEWIRQPVNAILLLLNIGFMFFHAAYGVEEVLMDYVPNKISRVLSIAVIKGLALVLALTCAWAVLFIAFGSTK